MPPGFRRSLATFATTFELPIPSEHESRVVPRTAVWIASATGLTAETELACERSTYPSSRPVRSTVGTTSATASHTASEYDA
jgi:hypothetical protein